MEAVSKCEEKYSAKTRDEIEVTAEFAKLFSDSATYSSYLMMMMMIEAKFEYGG